MVEIKTLVLERIFLLSQTPFSHFPNYVTYKADIVLFSRLESLFLKRYFVSSFFFNFGSILREVYKIVKKKKKCTVTITKTTDSGKCFYHKKQFFL